MGCRAPPSASVATMQADIPSVICVLILDSDGQRICCKYFTDDFPTLSEQQAFEKKVFDKSSRTNAKTEAEITVFDNLVTVYKNSSDAWFFVVSGQHENELILVNVLTALTEALTTTLRQLDKRTMLDNYESLLLTVDELIDGGMILETDASSIANRVGMKAATSEPAAAAAEPSSSFSFTFSSAKESFARSLLR
mmetsp:Transcript_15768/g.46038  ORF Transcript_15768/g.46038 Transcript_15768/m.46038 type:complete len:195 (-) Transcript_15768:312-896(-)